MKTARVCYALGIIDLLGDNTDAVDDVGLILKRSLIDPTIFEIVSVEPPKSAPENDKRFLLALCGSTFDIETSKIHKGNSGRVFRFHARGVIILQKSAKQGP